MDSVEQLTAPQHTPDSLLRYSKFSARSTGWLAWATPKTLLNSSHVLLWYTWSAGAFAFTQTAYLFKLVIPTTNALPRWRLNVETKTKRTLHSSRRLSFNELANAKNLELRSSHFALNWRCCTAVQYASALAVVSENLGPPLSNVMCIIHIHCIVQEIQTYEIESIFLNHAVLCTINTHHTSNKMQLLFLFGLKMAGHGRIM